MHSPYVLVEFRILHIPYIISSLTLISQVNKRDVTTVWLFNVRINFHKFHSAQNLDPFLKTVN